MRRPLLRPLRATRLRAGDLGPAAIALPLAASTLFATRVATAHEIVPGVTGFASMVLHPFVEIESAMLLLALALAVGATLRPGWLAASCCSALAGAALGIAAQPHLVVWPGLWRLPLVLALLFGSLLASGRALGPIGSTTAAFVVAATVALGAAAERPGLAGKLEVWAAVGVAIIIALVAVGWLAALVRRWAGGLALRVGGAWIAAIAALGLAAALR